jgi:hypothetical protein
MWKHVNDRKINKKAHRVFGCKFKLERKIDQPGLVYEADVKKSSKRPTPSESTKTRSLGKIKVASPSVAHMRSAGPQPLDNRAPISRPRPGGKGVQLTVIFPTLMTTLYNIDIAESATR